MKKYIIFSYILCCLVMLTFFIPSGTAYATTEYQATTPIILYEIENATSMDYVNENIVLSDHNNEKIVNKNNNSYINLDGNAPKIIKCDYHNNIYFTRDDLDGIYYYNTELTTYNLYSNNSITSNIREVLDISCNIENTIFAVAKNTSEQPIIIYKEENDNIFKLYCELSFSLNNAKLCASIDNDFLILCNNNMLYKISNNLCNTLNDTNILTDITYTIPQNLNNVIDIQLDYHDTLYILDNNNSDYTFYRCEKNEKSYNQYSTTNFNNCVTFCLDYITGDIFSLSDTALSKFQITNGISSFTNVIHNNEDINYVDNKYTVILLSTITETPLYQYDNSLCIKQLNSNNIIIPTDTPITALKLLNTGYYYVLISNLTNNNITGYIKSNQVEIISQQTTQNCKVIIPNTIVYNYPTSLDNAIIANDKTLTINTIVNVTNKDLNIIDSNNIHFIEIEIDNSKYYIDKNCITQTNNLQETITGNAHTTKTIIVYSDNDCNTTLTTLQSGTEIQILEQNNGIAKITWGLGTSIGYISTDSIQTDDINKGQIVGLILMIVCIIIAIVIICITCSNKKIQDE